MSPEPSAPPPDDPRKPASPGQLPMVAWRGVLQRTVSEFKADDCTDWAAALTYYGVLSLFPAFLAIITLVGLVGDPSTTSTTLLDVVREVGPQSAVDTLAGPVEQGAQGSRGTGLLFIAGLLGALWAASGYVGAFGRASNAIYEVEEARPFWKLRPLQVLITLVCVALAAVVTLALLLSGPLADAVGRAMGLGDLGLTLWGIVKWPLMLVAVSLILSVLYYATPNVKQPRWVWLTPGSVLALAVWALASTGFSLYVSSFGSYNATYGSLGAVIVFLVWLWLTNCAVLLGAELNAELERGREIEAGIPGASDSIQLPPRSAKATEA